MNDNESYYSYEHAHCPLFTKKRCTSCSLLALPSGTRLNTKLEHLIVTLGHLLPAADLVALRKHTVIPSTPFRSRTKLKYSIGGTFSNPTIGILSREFEGVDLTQCPLPPVQVEELLNEIKKWISSQRIPVYDVRSKTGLLKGAILLLEPHGEECILRIVVKDNSAFLQYADSLLALQRKFSWLKVISVNTQSLHAAIPEGPIEELLTSESRITAKYGELLLTFGPQSFMQVTPEVAAKLYYWCAECLSLDPPDTVLDLFCGVGGFSLTASKSARAVVGIEISENAVQCAKHNALQNGITNVDFIIGDMLAENPMLAVPSFDALVVNPPRRGLGERLCNSILEQKNLTQIFYSSCNPKTLVDDLLLLSKRFTVRSVRAFDMFPLTAHIEVAIHATS